MTQETLKQSNKLEDSIIDEMSNDWETMSQQITFKQETLEEEINIWLLFWGGAALIFAILWIITQFKFKK